MAKTRGIRLRINRQRVEALCEICDEMLGDLRPENEHQHLLHAYLLELNDTLRRMIKQSQGYYTLFLKSADAIAFYQLWNMLDISNDRYATIIVDGLIKKISAIAA